jgi:hypothetical protein
MFLLRPYPSPGVQGTREKAFPCHMGGLVPRACLHGKVRLATGHR